MMGWRDEGWVVGVCVEEGSRVGSGVVGVAGVVRIEVEEDR